MSKAWPVRRLDPEAPLAVNARRILAVRIAEYYSYAPIVDDATADDALHALRIAAKRLRYTLELFRAVFEETGERCIERVRAIQEELGNLHDHDVRIALIEDELKTLSAEQTTTLGESLATAPTTAHQAITAALLRPPRDDPRHGLVSLLARQYADRRGCYERFKALWDVLAAAGLRADLVGLSVTPNQKLAPQDTNDH